MDPAVNPFVQAQMLAPQPSQDLLSNSNAGFGQTNLLGSFGGGSPRRRGCSAQRGSGSRFTISCQGLLLGWVAGEQLHLLVATTCREHMPGRRVKEERWGDASPHRRWRSSF
jgi:hypothetical protein